MQMPILFGGPSGVRAGAVAERLARDYEVLRTADLASALRECRRRRPVAAVLPFPRGAAEGEVLSFLLEQGRQTAVFLYTEAGPAPAGAAYRVLAAGARGLLDAAAPDFGDDLGRRLTRLVRDLRVRHDEDQARARLFAAHDLVGASPAMRDVFRRAIKANQFTDLPVLIEGEKGTPVRRLVSAILYLDPTRVRMPFFALNGNDLGRMLENLRDLGGAKAPTVPEQWQELLRAARGGTIFLDRVGWLDAELQRGLLEVVRRRPAEVRVIVATERPADELVDTGALDPELWSWLSLFRIPLPPLRGRPEDVAAQALHVLDTHAGDGTARVTAFGPGALERLGRLPWEGNTTQLETVLRQALTAKGRGSTLDLDDLPAWVREVSPEGPPPEPVPHPGDWVDEECALDLAADDYERRLLRALMSRQSRAEAVRPDYDVG
jgi:DNA-binding NtrC family response regulator